MLARDIAKGADPKTINITPEEVIKCRKTLRQKISVEKGIFEKNKKANEIKQDNIKKIDNDNRKQTGNHRPRSDNICGRWVNYKCWKGENCTFKHPVMCDSDVNRTYYTKIPCDLYHPQVCSTNLSHKICKWGKNVNLDIYIMMDRDTAMKIINADMTDTMIIMVTI